MTRDLSRRVLGASAILAADQYTVVDVDLEDLARRLILFDKYILSSVRLQEFPILVNRVGYGQIRELLASRILDVRCECLTTGQLAQTDIGGKPRYPLFHYRIDWIDAANRKDYVSANMRALDGLPGVTYKQVSKLKRAIDASINELPRERVRAEVSPLFENDILHNPGLVRAAIDAALVKRGHVVPLGYRFSIRRIDAETFFVNTNVHDLLHVEEAEGHKIIEFALLAVAGLSQNLAEMMHYSAVSGFRESEIQLYRQKLGVLASLANAKHKEVAFQRVVSIAELPDFLGQGKTLDIERLLKVREMPETREFRDWLGTVGSASDSEIYDRVTSFRAHVGVVLGSRQGKAMRFVANGLIGLTAVPAIGLVAGAIDTFLVDKLLPRSGIAAFVDELYPSLFKVNS